MRLIVLIAPLALALLFLPGLSKSGLAQQDYVLALSWQPAFCETLPDLPECRSQTEDRFDARHFALHGLWPEPRNNVYCGVPNALRELDRRRQWGRLPALDLSSELRTALNIVMPGAQSYLHRHEWIKHGTCHEVPEPESYFRDSMRLLDEINRSGLQELFEDAIALTLPYDTIRTALDLAFGNGAGDRIEVICKPLGSREVIVELRLNLSGPISDRPLADLIRDARPRQPGCDSGIVDAVGITG